MSDFSVRHGAANHLPDDGVCALLREPLSWVEHDADQLEALPGRGATHEVPRGY